MPSLVKKFGADPRGERDSLPALLKALEWRSKRPALGGFNATSRRFTFGPGRFIFEGAFTWPYTDVFEGDGGGLYPATVLEFPQSGGITLEGHAATLRGLTLVGARSGYGIVIRNNSVHLDDVGVFSFVDGIHIESYPSFNCNLWSLFRVWSRRHSRHGLYVHGQDAGKGDAYSCDFSDNGGAGVWDDAQYPNNYFGCHAEGNQGGPFVTEADKQYSGSVAWGRYDESGQPPIRAKRGMFLGGSGGAGFSPDAIYNPLVMDGIHSTPFKVDPAPNTGRTTVEVGAMYQGVNHLLRLFNDEPYPEGGALWVEVAAGTVYLWTENQHGRELVWQSKPGAIGSKT